MDFEAWRRFLFAASVFFAVFGLVAAVGIHTFLFDMWTSQIDAVFFGGQPSESALAMRNFLMGPLGGTIAGSYTLQSFIVAVPFKNREPWAWWAVLIGMLVWFVIDSSVSLWHGAVFNVWMINLTPIVVFGIPLIATRKAFAPPAG